MGHTVNGVAWFTFNVLIYAWTKNTLVLYRLVLLWSVLSSRYDGAYLC